MKAIADTAAFFARITIPSNVSVAALLYEVPKNKEGLPDYAAFENDESQAPARQALNALCDWFEDLDKKENKVQIERIANAISKYVRGPGQVYDFFVKIIHHKPSCERLSETGIIKFIRDDEKLMNPLRGIIGGKAAKAPNILKFEAGQNLFGVNEKGVRERFYSCDSEDSDLLTSSASTSRSSTPRTDPQANVAVKTKVVEKEEGNNCR